MEKVIPRKRQKRRPPFFIGKDPGLFSPFYCEYGVSIHAGRDCFVNCSCVFLDVAPITLEDGVWIGAISAVSARLLRFSGRQFAYDRPNAERAEPYCRGSDAEREDVQE